MGKKSAKGSLTPRNGHLAAALFRKAGAHTKSNKANRQGDRLRFQNKLRSGDALRDDTCSRSTGGVRTAAAVACNRSMSVGEPDGPTLV
jgi:hypothetical protein